MALDLPESLADAWQPLGTRTAETNVMMATIAAETTLYEPVEPTGIAALGPSDGEIPLRSLFTVDLSFSPPLPAVGVSPASVLSMAAPKAKAQFVDTVENEGLDVRRTRDTLEFEAPNGAAGKWYVLDVAYPVALAGTGDADSSSDGDGDGNTAVLPAEAHVAVWPTSESYGMAGGTVPLKPEPEPEPESRSDAGNETQTETDDDQPRNVDRGELESLLATNDTETDVEPEMSAVDALFDPERDRETVATLLRGLET